MIGLAFAVLMIVGAFLPWAKVEVMGMSETFSGFMGSKGSPGALTVIFGILCIVFLYLNKKWSNITAIVFALLSIAWVMERFGTIKEKMGEVPSMGELSGLLKVEVNMGVGLYVIIIGGIGIVIGAVMAMRAPKA